MNLSAQKVAEAFAPLLFKSSQEPTIFVRRGEGDAIEYPELLITGHFVPGEPESSTGRAVGPEWHVLSVNRLDDGEEVELSPEEEQEAVAALFKHRER